MYFMVLNSSSNKSNGIPLYNVALDSGEAEAMQKLKSELEQNHEREIERLEAEFELKLAEACKKYDDAAVSFKQASEQELSRYYTMCTNTTITAC